MRIYAYFFLLLSILLTSCNNTIENNDDWSDVTIIYGLLDPAADTNWIRVQRGFLAEDNPNQYFTVSDSLYYKNIKVILESFKPDAGGGLGQRVDSFALVKDNTSRALQNTELSGNGHHLYRTQRKLNHDLIYKVSVLKADGGPVVTATTPLVHNSLSHSSGFRFKTPDLTSLYDNEFIGVLEWYAAEGAAIYKVDLRFYYKQFDTLTKEVEHKYVDIKDYSIIPNYNNLEYFAYSPFRNVMYKAIANNIGLPPKNKLRFFEKMQFTIWAASPAFYTYARVNAPKEGLNVFVPEVPGIENGTGLFASRTSITLDDIPLHQDMKSTYYLSKALCNRGFAVAQGLDTCFCEIKSFGTNQKCIEN